jgi:Ni,Fe-hydrogenase I small subunit
MKNARFFIKQRAFFLTGCPATERTVQLYSYQRIAFCRRADKADRASRPALPMKTAEAAYCYSTFLFDQPQASNR